MTTGTLALRRARRRRKSAGAAMFIVAITLGLLAAMGVYGLSATAYDVRAAGAGRAAAQGQHAAELAIVMTSQVLTPPNAQAIVNRMRADHGTATEVCKTARMYSTNGDALKNRTAEACLVLTPETMKPLGVDPTTWVAAIGSAPVPFTPQSFGEVPDFPKIRVELTNPVDYPAPPGWPPGSLFTSLRATVFVEMRPTSAALPADSIAQGRGRIVVGPYTP